MNFLCVNRVEAEKTRKLMIKHKLLDKDVKIEHVDNLVCFPHLNKIDDNILDKIGDYEYREIKAKRKTKIRSFHDLLVDKISDEDFKKLPKSYDIVGSVAIVNLDDSLDKKLVADAIIESSKSIKTVLDKKSERATDFRLYKLEHLGGDKNSETIHRESGFLFKLDPKLVYFSPREATERERVANFVDRDEKILAMFAGVGPYAIHCAKKTKNKVVAVELNSDGVRYLKENIKLNNLDNIEAIEADVSEYCPKHIDEFDRILMPLPKGAESYLNLAYNCSKVGGVIHLYGWGGEPDIFSNTLNKIRDIDGIKIVKKQKVLPYAPRVFKTRIDLEKIKE